MCGNHVCDERDDTEPFSCVSATPLGINQQSVLGQIVEKDQQVWFQLDVSKDITY
jgi:hypothetical protein